MRFFVLIISFFVLSCDSGGSKFASLFPESTSSNYFKKATEFKVEVYYETGAEPFTGNFGGGNPVWSIVEDNLTQIFSYKSQSPSLDVPTDTSQMTEIPSQNQTEWSIEEVIDLYKIHNSEQPTETKGAFYIYFLRGFSYSGSSTVGFSINDTPVIAIFKDVVEASGNLITQRFVEQSTIVHELGHALGFVNNGVPMAMSHQDTEHGAHTQNTDCVMYWLNEGVSDLRDFLANYIATGDTEMWGSEVLSDAQAFSE